MRQRMKYKALTRWAGVGLLALALHALALQHFVISGKAARNDLAPRHVFALQLRADEEVTHDPIPCMRIEAVPASSVTPLTFGTLSPSVAEVALGVRASSAPSLDPKTLAGEGELEVLLFRDADGPGQGIKKEETPRAGGGASAEDPDPPLSTDTGGATLGWRVISLGKGLERALQRFVGGKEEEIRLPGRPAYPHSCRMGICRHGAPCEGVGQWRLSARTAGALPDEVKMLKSAGCSLLDASTRKYLLHTPVPGAGEFEIRAEFKNRE